MKNIFSTFGAEVLPLPEPWVSPTVIEIQHFQCLSDMTNTCQNGTAFIRVIYFQGQYKTLKY